MKRTIVTLLLMLAMTMLALPCYADEAFWRGDVPPPHASRVAQACAWLEGFEKLDREVPTLSPSESAWLKREYDDQIESASGSFTRRALAAGESTEYHKRLARRQLNYILSALRTLCTRQRLSPKREIEAWILLTADIIDPELWGSVQTLVKRKVVGTEISGIKKFYLENHVGWGRAVLNRVVLPMLDESVQ